VACKKDHQYNLAKIYFLQSAEKMMNMMKAGQVDPKKKDNVTETTKIMLA